MPEPGSGESLRYRHILVPTDGSVGADRGARHAIDLAERFGATVHVLHVVDERTHGETPALSSEELVLEKLTEEAEEAVAGLVDLAAERGIETVSRSCRGVPADEITRYAAEHDVDLIVMGLHGSERGSRPHVGSTTERVLRQSPVPVFPV